MSVSRPGELVVDAQVKLGEDVWIVVELSDGLVHLQGAAGRRRSMPLGLLLTAPGFELAGAKRASLPQRGLLELLPEATVAKAKWWEEHVLAVLNLDGTPDGMSLRQREIAKVAELATYGQVVRLNVFQRMRRRYENEGLWGLIDQRFARRSGAYTDQLVLAAIGQAIAGETNRSTGTADQRRSHHGRVRIQLGLPQGQISELVKDRAGQGRYRHEHDSCVDHPA